MTDVPHRNPASSGGNAKPAIRIERLDAPDATAWQLIEEYYAAVQVVLRDSAASLQQLIDDMFDTMQEYQGVGLAAPQVHEGLRLFVAGFAPRGDEDDEE